MSDDTLTYSLAMAGPTFHVSRTTLRVELSHDHRRRALAAGWWPFRSARPLQEPLLRRIEGPHHLARLNVCLEQEYLRLGLPDGRYLCWSVPEDEKAAARVFVDEVTERILSRKRHQMSSPRRATSLSAFFAAGLFVLVFRWMARVARGLL